MFSPVRRRRPGTRSLAATALVVGVACFLAACSGSGSALDGLQATSTLGAAKPAGGCPADADVSMWLLQATASQQVVDDGAIKAFKSVCPGITVEVSYYTSANLQQKMTAALAGGTAPTLFETTGPQLSMYAAQGDVLTDLTAGLDMYNPDWKSTMVPSAVTAGTLDGKLLGFPSFIPRPLLLMYNKSVFDSAGVTPPKSLDQLDTVAKKLKDDGKIPVSLGNMDKFPGTYWLQYLIARNGGSGLLKDILADKKDAYSDPAVTKSLQQLRQYAEDGLFGKGYDTTGSVNGADKTLFYSGAAGMYVNGTWSLGSINQADPSFMKNNGLGFTSFPTSSSGNESVFGVPAEVYAVTTQASAAQKAAAEAYMATQMASKEYGTARIAIGNLPAVAGLGDDFPSTNAGKAQEFAYKLTLEHADDFQPSWYNALGTNASTFEEATASVINGSISPEKFVSEMNATL